MALVTIAIATTYIAFYLSPEGLSRIFGSPYAFLLTANSLLLYWYYRHPELIKIKTDKYSLVMSSSLLLFTILDGLVIRYFGLMHVLILLFWIFFNIGTLGGLAAKSSSPLTNSAS
jgi:hypothetical protein